MELAFLDEVWQAQAVAARWRINPSASTNDGFAIAMMEPAVHAALRRLQLPGGDTVAWFAPSSHQRLLEVSDQVVGWLRDQFRVADPRLGIEQGYREALVFWARPTLHYCLAVIEIALNAVGTYQPKTLLGAAGTPQAGAQLWIEPQDRWLGYLIRSIAGSQSLAFQAIEAPQRRSGLQHGAAERWPWLRFLLKHGHSAMRQHLIRWRRRRSSQGLVLLTTRHYQMAHLAARLQERHPALQFELLDGPILPLRRVPTALLQLMSGWGRVDMSALRAGVTILAEAILQEPERFTYRGISYAVPLAAKIRFNLADHLIGLQTWAATLDQWLAQQRPRAVVSCGNRGDEIVLAEICRARSISTILTSHGSHVEPKNSAERVEWGEHGRGLLRAPFSHLALSSPLAEGYLRAFPSSSRILSTGPLLWGAPVDPARSRAVFEKWLSDRYRFGQVRVVVHAGTPRPLPRLRPFVYETADEYVQAVIDVARAAEGLADTALLVAFRPTPEISVEDMKALVPLSSRVILAVNEPFLGLLGMADLVVSFSSTTIEEAFQNRVPVLLYGGEGRYQHVPAQDVVADRPVGLSAVYHVRQPGELAGAMDRILTQHRAAPPVQRRDLFAPYIYPPEARVSILADIANGHAPPAAPGQSSLAEETYACH